MRPITIYAIGIGILGLAYFPIKEQVSGPVFLAIVLAYAVVLRLLALRFGREEAAGDGGLEK